MCNFLIILFLNELERIWLQTSIAIVSTSLNGSYLTLIILINNNHLFAHREVVKSIAI